MRVFAILSSFWSKKPSHMIVKRALKTFGIVWNLKDVERSVSLVAVGY